MKKDNYKLCIFKKLVSRVQNRHFKLYHIQNSMCKPYTKAFFLKQRREKMRHKEISAYPKKFFFFTFEKLTYNLLI